MNQFNLGNFINRFIKQTSQNVNQGGPPINPSQASAQGNITGAEAKFMLPQENLAQGMLPKLGSQASPMNMLNHSIMTNLRMNELIGFERSLYIKDLMNLPKDLAQALVLIQNKTASTQEIAKLLNTNITISTLTELIQVGGKDAINKLVIAMSNASKQGITDLTQLKETMKLINASVSVAGQDNPNQTLKTFMLLYLPWLPLQEGVDFDLEVEGSPEEGKEGSEASITILISTKNYGNIRITLVLLGGGTISIIVNCSEDFPKEDLLKRLKEENKKHSIPSEITFEQNIANSEETSIAQAKATISGMTKVNPFLLLMANAVIKHAIELDNIAG